MSPQAHFSNETGLYIAWNVGHILTFLIILLLSFCNFVTWQAHSPFIMKQISQDFLQIFTFCVPWKKEHCRGCEQCANYQFNSPGSHNGTLTRYWQKLHFIQSRLNRKMSSKISIDWAKCFNGPLGSVETYSRRQFNFLSAMCNKAQHSIWKEEEKRLMPPQAYCSSRTIAAVCEHIIVQVLASSMAVWRSRLLRLLKQRDAERQAICLSFHVGFLCEDSCFCSPALWGSGLCQFSAGCRVIGTGPAGWFRAGFGPQITGFGVWCHEIVGKDYLDY